MEKADPRRLLELVARVLVVASLAVMAWVHLELYSADGYSSIPTIGWLFLVNGIAGSVLGLAMLLSPRRFLALVALASAGMLAGTFAGLVVSMHHTVFGWRGSTNEKYAWVALIDEAAGALIALAMVATRMRGSGWRAVLPVWRRA